MKTNLQKKLEKLKQQSEKDWCDPEFVKLAENHNKEIQKTHKSKVISKAVKEAKQLVPARPEPPQQLLFSFMPTQLTRTTPFFPMSRRQMKDRPYEELEWTNSWGTIRIEGKRLSIHDESVLLSLLLLVKKHKKGEFETTQNELCRIANTHTGKNTYNAIWESIKRLAKTSIDLDIYQGKGKERKAVRQMTGSILTFGDRDPQSGKLRVVFNQYFLQMYVNSFVTNLDLDFRASLKGDIAKSLYRFYEGQRDKCYSCHILKLAEAINLNKEMELKRLKFKIREAHKELMKKGYLSRHMIDKNNIVKVWKSGKSHQAKPLTIEDRNL